MTNKRQNIQSFQYCIEQLICILSRYQECDIPAMCDVICGFRSEWDVQDSQGCLFSCM